MAISGLAMLLRGLSTKLNLLVLAPWTSPPMALITISGYPCSGKSTRAIQLKDAFEEQLADPSYDGPVKKVVVVSDDLLSLTRQAYDGR